MFEQAILGAQLASPICSSIGVICSDPEEHMLMDRRQTIVLLSAGLAAGCGGGTTRETPEQSAGEPVAPPAPKPAPPLSENIAFWGDSLTRSCAPELALLYPTRAVHNGGIGGNTSTQIAARQTADLPRITWISLFWYGRNNYAQPNQVLADVTASVTHLDSRNERFLVLSVLNSRSEPRGSAKYQQVVELNDALATTFAGNYLDLRTHLVSLADHGVPQDVVDQENDVVPSSLRSDALHLNTAGSRAAAAKIKEAFDARGW